MRRAIPLLIVAMALAAPPTLFVPPALGQTAPGKTARGLLASGR